MKCYLAHMLMLLLAQLLGSYFDLCVEIFTSKSGWDFASGMLYLMFACNTINKSKLMYTG